MSFYTSLKNLYIVYTSKKMQKEEEEEKEVEEDEKEKENTKQIPKKAQHVFSNLPHIPLLEDSVFVLW